MISREEKNKVYVDEINKEKTKKVFKIFLKIFILLLIVFTLIFLYSYFIEITSFKKETISNKYQYNLHQSLDEIRPVYNRFYVQCKNSVPQAIICALDACSYEDALRNAVSLGGDSDTLACMAGGLAELRFKIPTDIIENAKKYMDKNIIRQIEMFYNSREKSC